MPVTAALPVGAVLLRAMPMASLAEARFAHLRCQHVPPSAAMPGLLHGSLPGSLRQLHELFAQLFQSLGHQTVVAVIAQLFHGHQPGLPHHPQVLGHRRFADAQHPCQRAHTVLPPGEQFQNPQPHGFTDGPDQFFSFHHCFLLGILFYPQYTAAICLSQYLIKYPAKKDRARFPDSVPGFMLR